MRLWTLHPKYLDSRGLVALWREALLARAVLRGETRGYRHHPQLERFKSQAMPGSAIDAYLFAVHAEAVARSYSFDRRKLGPVRGAAPIGTTTGQVAYEWRHLMDKLMSRSPGLYEQWRVLDAPECHPSFRVSGGGVEPWERA